MPFTSFVLATLALNLAPGPDMTYVAARSLGQGRRAGLISALGISFGCLFHVAMAAAGVAVILRAWPQAYAVVRMVGAAYLLYLGVGLIRHARDGAALTATTPDDDAAIFRQGIVTNVLIRRLGCSFSPSCRSSSTRSMDPPRCRPWVLAPGSSRRGRW